MAAPHALRAEQKAMPVIGFLSSEASGVLAPRVAAFQQGLGEAGYVEGKNVVIEYRWAEGHFDRPPALAAELVGRKVDLILTEHRQGARPHRAAIDPRPRGRGHRVRRLLLAVILVAGFAAHGIAAQVSGVPHVGLLHWSSPEMGRLAGGEFREGIRSLGWIEGSTISIEDRFADGNAARLSANAAEFVAAKVDVIVAIDSAPARAAQQATSAIPIVMTSGDPVGLGLVASLARPGGNVTGLSAMWPDLVAKQLQTLKEAVPGVSKIGVLLRQDSPLHAQLMTELERAAPNLGVSLLPFVVGADRELPLLFDEMTAAGADAYFVLNEPRTDAMRGDITALALRHRLPGAAQSRRYVDPAFVDPGLLVSYGVNLSAFHRRLALFVDKILKGAKPADLPVEQPTTFELVVNLKTATALGLTVPPSILARADEVIE